MSNSPTVGRLEYCSSSLQLAGDLDEVKVLVLAEMLSTDVEELVLRIQVVDADSVLLRQLLDKEVPQNHMFHP